LTEQSYGLCNLILRLGRDGRARTLDEAILWHGGEATAALGFDDMRPRNATL